MRLFFFLLLLMFLSSCGFGGDNQKKAAKNNTETTAGTNRDSELYMSSEAWQSWSPPKTLSGYTLIRFVTDPFIFEGLSSASARYEKDEVFITVQLIDGSTEKGKREIRDHLAIAEMQHNHSSEFGYEKTLERNGIKAKEEYLAPPAGQYLIKFMLREQYGVSVKSNTEAVAEIWDFIDQLHLDTLKQ